MKKFKEAVLHHLAEYKRNRLGVLEPGIYRRRDEREIEKEHILPIDKANQNLLPLVRDCYETLFDTAGKKIKWHTLAHHLNSSQSMAVNLFQPLLGSGERKEVLARILSLESPLQEAGFEHVPDPVEGTNVDFYARGHDGDSLLIEVKYTESDFGPVKGKGNHAKKFENLYKGRLAQVADFQGDEQAGFFEAYQFFRNAIHATPGGDAVTRVWFLVPSENDLINLAAQKAGESLKSETAKHVSVVHLEDLLAKIEAATGTDPELVGHYGEFRSKYLLPSG